MGLHADAGALVKPEVVCSGYVFADPFAVANGDQRRPLFLTAYAAAFVGILAAGYQAT